ncbi:DNRLRE domain-containing protein [Myxococcus sp. K38C18041901]|uniref:CBM96 family carbohydrate-binding protein n=1 Tax=Myxococcus guangdongensis TaxID=2906760 RepID=UPI0020A7B5EC|nr:DNRLRE domain-containing protein [Myxococcus guangdongensis]MCP3061571.1 DNRLRE domain-containing protein [Myxococcus guangdongensis]
MSTRTAALEGSVTLAPVADTQVTPSSPTTNYGTSGAWEVNRQFSHVYLRFDLGGLPAGATVTSVRLEATAFMGVAHGGDGNVYTTFVPDDSWSETALVWNNKPPATGDTLGEWYLSYGATPEDKLGVNASPALIPVVQGELDGDKLLSLRLHSPGYKTVYRSRESSFVAQRPRLVIAYTYSPPEVVTTLEPEADTYISGHPWEATADYGSAEILPGTLFWPESPFLRFNLGSLPAGALIKSVKLSAVSRQGTSPGGNGLVSTYLVPDNSWGEHTLNYTNHPPTSGEALGSWFVWYPNFDPLDRLAVNDSPLLIPAVQNASDATDRRISFRIVAGDYKGYYYSRETADPARRPKLEITYSY